MKKTVGIIGLGNMGKAIALVSSGLAGISIAGYDSNVKSLTSPGNKTGAGKIKITGSINELVRKSDIIIIAVKPQNFAALADQVKASASPGQLKNKLFISIMAGVTVKRISRLLGSGKVIRTMPNLALKIGKSVTAWIAGTKVPSQEKRMAAKIFSSWGLQFEVKKEKLLNVVTAASGSGPAYFFYLTECIARSAGKMGINQLLSEKLARQTLIGAAMIAMHTESSIAELRSFITSKKGTTDAAIKSLIKSGFSKIVNKALHKAEKRAEELAM